MQAWKYATSTLWKASMSPDFLTNHRLISYYLRVCYNGTVFMAGNIQVFGPQCLAHNLVSVPIILL